MFIDKPVETLRKIKMKINPDIFSKTNYVNMQPDTQHNNFATTY